MKYLLLKALFALQIFSGFSRKVTVRSSNQKVSIALFNKQNASISDWYLEICYTKNGETFKAFPLIDLKRLSSDQVFRKTLNLGKLINQSFASSNILCCVENAPNAAIRPMKWLSASKMRLEPNFLTSISEV